MLELCALWVMSAFEYFHTGRYCDFYFEVENESYASVTTPRVLVLLFSKCILILSNDFAEWKSYFWKNPPTSKFQPWRDKIAPHTGTIHLNSQKLYISMPLVFFWRREITMKVGNISSKHNLLLTYQRRVFTSTGLPLLVM